MKAKTALLCLIVVSLTVQANAATLTWDSNAATAPNPYDGGGTWNVTGLNWWNGTANVAWSNTTNASDIAAFGTPPAALYQNAGGVGLGAAAGSPTMRWHGPVPGGQGTPRLIRTTANALQTVKSSERPTTRPAPGRSA